MLACSLSLHIFCIGLPAFKDEQVLIARLSYCMEQIANVLKKAPNLADLSVDLFLWSQCYPESSVLATWKGETQLPNKDVVWEGIAPLKGIQGIKSISIRAGDEFHEDWSARDGVVITHV